MFLSLKILSILYVEDEVKILTEEWEDLEATSSWWNVPRREKKWISFIENKMLKQF